MRARVPLRAPGGESFRQPLRDFGCEIDGDLVRFPKPVRDRVLGRISEQKAAGNPPGPADIQDNPVEYVTNGQAFYCCDLDTKSIRPAATDDLAQWSQICDVLPDLGQAHPTFIPQDVSISGRDVHTFATVVLHSREPSRVSRSGIGNDPILHIHPEGL